MPVIDPDMIPALRDELLRFEPLFVLKRFEATEDDYEKLAHEDIRCEFLDGVMIVHSAAPLRHEERVAFLGAFLNGFSAARRIGCVYGPNAVMQIDNPKSMRFCADVSLLLKEHTSRIRGERVIGPMDLVVEVISKHTREYDLGEKRRAYRDGRVPEIWLLDYGRKQARFDLLVGRSYEEESMTSGRFNSRVLPGLSLDVGWIWGEELPDPLACLNSLKPASRKRSKR